MDQLDRLLAKPTSYWRSKSKPIPAPPHLALSDCSICATLERYYLADYIASGHLDIPTTLQGILSGSPNLGEAGTINQCSQCGAYYRSSRTVLFMEDDLEVYRVSPTEACFLPSAELVDQWIQELSHAEVQSRAYAAQCLTDYYAAQHKLAELEELLHHPDREVRLMAVIYLRSDKTPEYQTLLEKIYQTDPDEQVRLNVKL